VFDRGRCGLVREATRVRFARIVAEKAAFDTHQYVRELTQAEPSQFVAVAGRHGC